MSRRLKRLLDEHSFQLLRHGKHFVFTRCQRGEPLLESRDLGVGLTGGHILLDGCAHGAQQRFRIDRLGEEICGAGLDRLH